MLKTIFEFTDDLTDEELGRLIKMSKSVINNEEVKETDNRVINYLFNTQFKPAAKAHARKCEVNKKNAKLGGRPKKKGVNENGGN